MTMGFVPPSYKGIMQDEDGWWSVTYSGKSKIVKGPFETEALALIASVEPRRRKPRSQRPKPSILTGDGAFGTFPTE